MTWRRDRDLFQYLVSQFSNIDLINTDKYEKSSYSKMDVFVMPRLRWEFITRHVSLIDSGTIDINSRWATHNKPGLRIEAKEKPMIIIFDKYSKNPSNCYQYKNTVLRYVSNIFSMKKKKKKKKGRFNAMRKWQLKK